MSRYIRVAVAFLVFLIAGCGGGGSPDPSSNNTNLNPPPLIMDFTPKSGAEGESVQISGLLFSNVASENTVSINGVTANVNSAIETEIVITVPLGATSGRITVTTAGGSATTSTDFNVLGASTTPGVSWTTRITGLRESPSGIVWDGSKYVVAGDSILTSTDIVRWDERDTFSWLYDLKWNGQRFVGVGNFGHILTSTDGLTWTQILGSEDLYGVTYSDSLWVAVGDAGIILTSADGISWTSRTSPVSGGLTILQDVAWNGSLFVAVGSDGIIITSPDGITWTQQTSGTGDSFTAVAATPSLIVASTFPSISSTTAIYTSTDGASWTQQATGIGNFNDIIYAGGKWVGVSSYSVARSTDGISWDVSNDGPGNTIGFLEAVTYDGSRYVAVGDWEGSVYTSPDAVTWSLRASEQQLRALARRPADGRLVAVATSKQSMVSTDDGATWQFGGMDTNVFLDVEWYTPLNAFVALVQVAANESIYTSTDGLGWTELASAPLHGRLGASATRLVSVGADLVSEGIAMSTDGAIWTDVYTTTADKSLQEVFWTGSQFIAVGENGAIVTSPDGITWTARNSGVTATLYGAAASPTRLAVVGTSGTIVTSDDDGTTWVQQSSGTTYRLNRVSWTGAEFVAVGINGKVFRSTDGLTWNEQPTPYNDVLFGSDYFHLNSILWTGSAGRLVVVGDRGLVTTSP